MARFDPDWLTRSRRESIGFIIGAVGFLALTADWFLTRNPPDPLILSGFAAMGAPMALGKKDNNE